ncbi:hypothetical protein [Leptolyngbya sp. BL0902]|uniref:hypothetical protein n=1 Tax=Leptolyngbya sp. BL0902 TaxID=1115757 RepID=UPI0018E6FF73|nr:hypothetical protein [Leptolyngbya sp. BL0902]
MKDNKKSSKLTELVVYPILVAALVAGTSPWWLNEIRSFLEPKNLPLQVGNYESGSRYITLFKRGDRFCFLGSTARGSSIASIFEDPKGKNVYRINGFGNAQLIQKDYETLFFGGGNYELSADQRELPTIDNTNDQDIRQCLESSEPFLIRYVYDHE